MPTLGATPFFTATDRQVKMNNENCLLISFTCWCWCVWECWRDTLFNTSRHASTEKQNRISRHFSLITVYLFTSPKKEFAPEYVCMFCVAPLYVCLFCVAPLYVCLFCVASLYVCLFCVAPLYVCIFCVALLEIGILFDLLCCPVRNRHSVWPFVLPC